MAKTKKIEVIEGKTNPNIILVAPHGVKGDDDNAGKLAKAIQKRLGCHAIINEAFKRPEDKEDGSIGDFDAKKGLYDLNYKPHAQAHPTFINNITDKMTEAADTFVFWIHGIDDAHLVDKDAKKFKYENAKCLVGYGQGKGNGKSMDEKRAKAFIKNLKDNDLAAVATHTMSPKYRGAGSNNMNQYFKDPAVNLVDVQSVQLEFAKKGVREGKEIAKAGNKVAKAISELVGCDLVSAGEEKADEILVKEATLKVMEFVTANHNNCIAVGRYLIEKFYKNDFDLARKGKKVKGKSLNRMLEDLEKKPDTPSKSWFYNTINLAVDDEEFKNDTEYKKLNLSHKIYLTYLNKKKEYRTAKLGLIKEIAQNGMAIKDLSTQIAEIKAKDKPKQEWPSVEDLMKMEEDEIAKQKDKAENRKKAIQNKLDKLNEKLAEQQAKLQKCDLFLSAVNDTNLSDAA